MRQEKDINVEMFWREGIPFVKVDYVDKDAQEHTALMVLDSGSDTNLLSCEMASRIGERCKTEGTAQIRTITHEVIMAKKVRFSFTLEGTLFHETFNISQVAIPCQVEGFHVIGILGNVFMQKHRLVIDYSDFTFHTSNVSPTNLAISDCDFFFPMNVGLEIYSIPVLAIRHNGKDIVAVADSGATDNVIAKQTIKTHGMSCWYLNDSEIVMGINGSAEAERANVKFRLLTLQEKESSENIFHEDFKVVPYYLLELDECDENGDPLPPVEAIIGSPFMAKQGWVLDFAQKVIYKRKCQTF